MIESFLGMNGQIDVVNSQIDAEFRVKYLFVE